MASTGGHVDLDNALESRTFEVNGIQLHAMLGGPEDGPLVVLLHGFPEFWYSWRHQIPALIEAGYRVCAPDLRGYNKSTKPHNVEAYSKDLIAEDVLQLVDSLGHDKAHFVAHDWGGMIGWWLGLKHPGRINRLVLLNIPHPVVFNKTLKSSFSQLKSSWYMGFFQIPYIAEWYLARQGYRALKGAFKDAQPGAFTREDKARYVEAWSQPGAVHGMLQWYRAPVRVKEPDPASWRVTPPTLLLWGVKDTALTEQMAAPSIDFCDDGELVRLDGSHWVASDCPEEVNAHILRWLSGNPS